MAIQLICKRTQYKLLQDKDLPRANNNIHVFSLSGKSLRNILIAVFLFSLSGMAGIAGFVVGRQSNPQEATGLVKLKNFPMAFIYNRTFTEAPSDVTDQVWESLFPARGGFFGHPTLPEGDRFDFAVYHQLHCLNGIRGAYWNLRNGIPHSGKVALEHSAHSQNADAHVRHCIDYLRQTLICMSDTTIEVVEMVPNGDKGVKGFGTQHTCKDFRQLDAWTTEWEDFGL